jgi:hypothetical protein
MASRQFLAMLSTATLVTGALLVGDALHGGVVTNQYSPTSPAAVFRLVPGVALIWVGYRLKRHHDELVGGILEGSTPSVESDEEEFDEELSPLDQESLENLETRDGE